MIIDKHGHDKPVVPEIPEVQEPEVENPLEPDEGEAYEGNPMSEIFRATQKILQGIKRDTNDPNSEPLFRTIKLNYGQLTRIKHDKFNTESALAFPAAFIHLINVRWLVQASRIGEGRGELRICYVLNRLNIEDDEHQTEGFEVFQLINNAINANKANYPIFTERLQLTYWDQVENFDDGLQQYWITYEVWFKDYSSYQYKNYVDRYLVIPPFTDHSDQLPENNKDGHSDHTNSGYDDAAGFSR